MVHLYRSDDELVATVVTYLADAVFAGGLAIAVATPSHRAAIAERLATTDDLPPAVGSVLLLDARDLLKELVAGGRPDPRRFEASVGALVAAAARAVRASHELAEPRPVHIFGEMVALLWEDGRVAEAIELEDMWNSLRGRHQFSLLCGYPSSLVGRPEVATALHEVCRLHGVVIGGLPRPAPAAPSPAFGSPSPWKVTRSA